MALSAQELMKPRFEVIADYPYCPVNIGEQLEYVIKGLFVVLKIGETNHLSYLSEILKMSHLFRKLNWWEHRKVEDMPKKLLRRDVVYDIADWDMSNMIGFTNDQDKYCDLQWFTPDNGYFPVD